MNKYKKQVELNKISSTILDQLNEVSLDPMVVRRPDLQKMIAKYMRELQETENVDLVAEALCKSIGQTYLMNNQNYPQSLIDLYYRVKVEGLEYDGISWSATQAGLTWFE